MSMPVIDAVVRADRPFVIQGYGKTYELTEDEFNAAMRAADALSDGARLLTTGQAADILGVTAKTVARIIDAGRIPRPACPPPATGWSNTVTRLPLSKPFSDLQA